MTLLSIDQVSKRYGEGEDAVQAIDEISLDVGEQEFISVVGPSGCGKSTLLHLISGVLSPTSGRVTLNGTNVQSPAHEKHRVGLVFQDPVLLQWRAVLKNVLLPVEIMHENGVFEDMEHYRQRAKDLLELVNLGGFEDSHPNELSGGMQQRVSICRSLVYDPPLLLMDEPFGALDALTREQMNQELLRIWRETEKTILFVTHNLEEAVYLSDRVVVLSQRPTQVLDVIEIDLERPRSSQTKTTADYQSYLQQTYDHFEVNTGNVQ